MERNQEHGFTLVEMLLVLGIWSIIAMISVPLVFSAIEKQKENHFFQTLTSDILYLQTLSNGEQAIKRKLLFEKDHYLLQHGLFSPATVRQYPNGWEKENRANSSISFKNGTIREPGTIVIHGKRNKYKIIFPLGKGREYVEKQ